MGTVVPILPSSERQDRPLTQLEPEQQCEWNIKRQRAYELMDAAAVVGNLSEISDILPKRESYAAPLAPLSTEQQCEAWRAVVNNYSKNIYSWNIIPIIVV